MPTQYDESNFPVVVLNVQGPSTNEEVLERIDYIKSVLKRKQRFAFIFDAGEAEPINAAQRRMWTDWLEKDRARLGAWVVGCAFVVGSPMMRGVFTGIFWIWPPPMPYVFTDTLPEAVAWAKERLGTHARPEPAPAT